VTPPFAGAVLCGGASTRMGRDKALIVLEGVPLARRVADALLAAGAGRVLAVGGDLEGLAAHHLPGVPDRWPGQGPLGGVITALGALEEWSIVVVLACDLLDPDPGAIRAVVEGAGREGVDVAAPLADGLLQLQHAAWRSAVRGPLDSRFAAGERSLWRAVRGLRSAPLDGIVRSAYADADTPDDLPA
jgi:molybdenum cofactor guanylyltransferase